MKEPDFNPNIRSEADIVDTVREKKETGEEVVK